MTCYKCVHPVTRIDMTEYVDLSKTVIYKITIIILLVSLINYETNISIKRIQYVYEEHNFYMTVTVTQ